MPLFSSHLYRTLLATAAVAALTGTAHAATAATASTEAWSATRTQPVDLAGFATGTELAPNESLHIAVSLKLRNQAALDAFTADILSGRSTARLTTEQVLTRHAPTVAQAEAVAAHLRQAGFSNVQIAKNRMLVTGDASAAIVQRAFHTTLRHVDVHGRLAIANTTPAHVPAHLASIVNAVHGLDTVSELQLHYRRADPMAVNAAAASGAAATAVGHEPKEFATIYGADGLPTGSKTTIAVMSAGDISQTITDLNAFIARNGYAAPVVEQVQAGPASTDTAGVIEWDLDSQSAIGAAGGQVGKLVFYVATNVNSLTPFVEAFNQAVADNEAKIVNASLGSCEADEKANGNEAAIDASLQIGVAQGQTFTFSSGDSGAYQCNRSKKGASYPAVSQYATAIGGTKVFTNNGTQWASESAWSCSGYLLCQQLLGGGGGGGTSTTVAAPSWQVAALGPLTGRSIPDISFSGDPSSGAILVVNGGAKLEQVGGTSLSAPMFMGFGARIQSMNNNVLTSPTAAIYKYTSVPANALLYTHDVTTGSQGYAAAPGWDLATGYGSLDIGKLSGFIDSLRGR